MSLPQDFMRRSWSIELDPRLLGHQGKMLIGEPDLRNLYSLARRFTCSYFQT